MKEVRLLYASTVADNFDPAELEDILKTARARNAKEGMTGVLFFNTSHFVQCLEGSRKAVNALYGDMHNDPRHRDLVLLSYKDIDERMFGSWGMAYIKPDDIAEEILEKHSVGPDISPENIDADMADAMLLLLLRYLNK